MTTSKEKRKLWDKYDSCRRKGSFKSLATKELYTLAEALSEAISATQPFAPAEVATQWFVTRFNEVKELIRGREKAL